MMKFRHECAVHIVHEWQQLALGFQFEVSMLVQQPFHNFLSFFRLQPARAGTQNAAGF